MSVGNTKIFRDWCKQIEEHPVSQGSDIIFKSKTIASVFEALKSDNGSQGNSFTISGQTINTNQLTPKDLKIFTHCTRRFFKNNTIPEKEAGKLLENINTFHSTLTARAVNNQKLQDICNETKKAKEQLLLHEEITSTKGEAQRPFVSEITNRITQITTDAQVEAKKLENEYKKIPKAFREEERLTKIKDFIPPLLMIGASAGLSVGLLVIVVASWPIGLALVGIGFIFGLASIPKAKYVLTRETITEDYKKSIKRLETLEELRKLSQTKEFDDFARKNNATSIQKDSDVVKFLQLYKLQTSNNLSPDQRTINQLRSELKLQPN